MIEAEHAIVIAAPIDSVWDYVQQISGWAALFPGCTECRVIDDHHSNWVIKVGAGGMVRTVNVLVAVEQWQGPGRVDFSYRLEKEPVIGRGSYIASDNGAGGTNVQLKLKVEGSGSMAPMWEAVSKPLLPQLARTFSDRLRQAIESASATTVGVPTSPAGIKADQPVRLTRMWRWLRSAVGRLFGSHRRDQSDVRSS